MHISIVNLVFLLAWIGLAIPKRTRPLTMIVVTFWLLKEAGAAIWIDHDSTSAIGGLILVAALCVNMIWHKREYIHQLKGKSLKKG